MNFDVVRAWKDAAYRASLSAEEQALLPVSPAGEIELSEAELDQVHGHGSSAHNIFSILPAAAATCVQSNVASPTAPSCISVGGGDCLNFG